MRSIRTYKLFTLLLFFSILSSFFITNVQGEGKASNRKEFTFVSKKDKKLAETEETLLKEMIEYQKESLQMLTEIRDLLKEQQSASSNP